MRYERSTIHIFLHRIVKGANMDKKIRKIITMVMLLFAVAITGIVVWKCTSVYYKKHPQTEIKEVVNTQNVYIEKDIIISGETIEYGGVLFYSCRDL